MAETTLGRLQIQVDKLTKENIRLKESNERLVKENYELRKRLDRQEKEIDEKIEKAVTKAVADVVAKFEKIIKEKDQRIFELENRLNINSGNSSLPSSQTPIYQSKICNSRKPTGDKPGRKEGHKKNELEMFKEEEITEYVEHTKDTCDKCNSHNLELVDEKYRDEYDIEVIIKKIRHKFYEYKCIDCGAIVKTDIPIDLHGNNQYGKGIKAFLLTLSNYGFVSYNRIRKITCGLTNGVVDPSEGYLSKLPKKASNKLDDFVFDVKEKILKSDLVYWDDTVIKIGEKDKACLRVYTNELCVLYKAHLAKDTDGMDEDGILNNLPSTCTVMHDHLLHNYSDDYNYQNIECNAHITRKLEGITQNANHSWSDEMKKLLEETLQKRKDNISIGVNSFTENEINIFDNQYDKILEDGFKEYIEFKHKYEFEKEENLLEFMRDYKEFITAWVKDYTLPYSNNLCESLLRMMKAKMKISYQFKNLNYAEYFANIMTYTETCGRFGINKYEAIYRLFDNNPYTIKELYELKKDCENTEKVLNVSV